jgi:hypothetical protein
MTYRPSMHIGDPNRIPFMQDKRRLPCKIIHPGT